MTSALVFAYHDIGVRCLSVLLAQGVRVQAVVTHQDNPTERIWFASVSELARSQGIPVFVPENPNRAEFFSSLSRDRPDFLFSFYYRHMLAHQWLTLPTYGAFNMHGSLLPKYRGRAPVNWAVIRGERETGATLHAMVEKPDAGNIMDQQAVPILPNDEAVEVFRKVTVAAELVLWRSLPALISGGLKGRAQELSEGSYFGGRRPDDGRIDWRAGAREIHNLVRGVAPPYPGAFTSLDSSRVAVLRTRIDETLTPRSAVPGLYVANGELRVDCADGKVLRLMSAEIEGQPLDAQGFSRRFGVKSVDGKFPFSLDNHHGSP